MFLPLHCIKPRLIQRGDNLIRKRLPSQISSPPVQFNTKSFKERGAFKVHEPDSALTAAYRDFIPGAQFRDQFAVGAQDGGRFGGDDFDRNLRSERQHE